MQKNPRKSIFLLLTIILHTGDHYPHPDKFFGAGGASVDGASSWSVSPLCWKIIIISHSARVLNCEESNISGLFFVVIVVDVCVCACPFVRGGVKSTRK